MAIKQDSLASMLGGALGTGIGKGVGGFFEQKLQDMAMERAHRLQESQLSKKAQLLKQLRPELSDQQAYALTGLGDKPILQYLEQEAGKMGGIPGQEGAPSPSIVLRKPEKAAAEKPNKENQAFNLKVDEDLSFAQDILPILDKIDSLLSEGGIQTGSLYGRIPADYFDERTQELDNLFNALLVKQTNAESQGRGSNLLRQMIKEGKLSRTQNPKVMRKIVERLREEEFNKLMLDEARNEIVSMNNGKEPMGLSSKAHQLVSKEKTTFQRLSDEEKLNYLLKNPNKMKHIKELVIDGNVAYRRNPENNEWESAA